MLTMGIDIGSTTCKGIVMRDGAEILSRALIPLGTGTQGQRRILGLTLERAGVGAGEIGRIVATGYGRLTFGEAHAQHSELGCHAMGVHFLQPQARTLIDVGGQDVKVLQLSARGRLRGMVMNDKCAAGTGRFLEVMARLLDVGIEELGPLSQGAQGVLQISSTCTVFAESEVISKLAGGAAVPDLVAGIHESVAKRVAGLVFRLRVEPVLAMSGGGARNGGLVRALETLLGCPISVHADCQLAGAVGAALYAHEELSNDQSLHGRNDNA